MFTLNPSPLKPSPVESKTRMPGLNQAGHVNTRDVLNVFEAKGWTVSSVNVLNPRKPEREGFQRHLIRLENPAFPSIPGLSEGNASKPQLCLLNSHDGTTATRLWLGALRFACLNGIISGTSLRDFKAVHSKNVLNRLADGIEYIANSMPALFAQVQALQSVTFDDSQIQAFVREMFDARLSGVGKVIHVNYSMPLLRDADRALDGFTVLNRVQETLIRGGIDYVYQRDSKDSQGNVINTQTVHATTRRLASIQGQIKLNRIAYDSALRIGAPAAIQLKQAA